MKDKKPANQVSCEYLDGPGAKRETANHGDRNAQRFSNYYGKGEKPMSRMQEKMKAMVVRILG